MTAALDDRDAPEGSTNTRAEYGLVVCAVRETHSRAQCPVVAGEEAASALSSGAVARKHERARIVVDGGIRLRRRKVRVLIAAGPRRLCELVAHAVVEDQLVVDPPVILRVKRIVRIDLLQIAHGLGPAAVRGAEQERGKRVAAGGGQRRRTRNARFKEAEAGPAADILLAEAIRLLAIEGKARLPRVRPPDQRHIVFHRDPRLLRPVVCGSAPRRKLGEREVAQVHVAIDGIGNAHPVFPVPADVRRVRVFVESIDAEGQVIHHPRPDDPVPGRSVKVGVEARGLKRVERFGKARGAGRPGLHAVVPPVEQVRQAMRVAERVVDFHAVLVGRFSRRPAGREVVVRHIAQRAWHEPRAIREDHAFREREVLLRDGAEPVGGNLVAGEGITDEP